ncbi:MAG: hypothetical protein WD016_12625 [Balneolaceae bacterium]
MNLQKVTTTTICLLSILIAGTSCKTFVVQDVNYAYQIESVLTPGEDGMVEDLRHGISFDIQPFLNEEFGEDSEQEIREVRLIRNSKGFYFITANQFNHVYVMEPTEGELKLKRKIEVSEEGLSSPAFNLREALVQLVEMDSNRILSLNENGIQERNEEEDQS